MTTWHVVLAATVVALVASYALTGGMRRYALASELLDTPNERSSHKTPTPRGGGVAIVVVFLAMLIGFSWAGLLEWRLGVALVGAGMVVAVLGFVDDRVGVSASKRFTGHVLASIWVLGWMGSAPAIPFFGITIDFDIFGPVVAVLFSAWMINLFNFMDGIDGIASVEAISAAAGGAWLWSCVGLGQGWIAALLFAACVAGFLMWNFPPAKIFMGDAGSGFLGLMIASLALWSGQATPALLWSWLILVGCFMVDATTTLVRRVRRGERFYEPHRTHAYQYASRRHGGHRPITLAVLLLNVLWLLPMASAVAFGVIDGAVGLAVAYAPLIMLAFRYKAGDRKNQEV